MRPRRAADAAASLTIGAALEQRHGFRDPADRRQRGVAPRLPATLPGRLVIDHRRASVLQSAAGADGLRPLGVSAGSGAVTLNTATNQLAGTISSNGPARRRSPMHCRPARSDRRHRRRQRRRQPERKHQQRRRHPDRGSVRRRHDRGRRRHRSRHDRFGRKQLGNDVSSTVNGAYHGHHHRARSSARRRHSCRHRRRQAELTHQQRQPHLERSRLGRRRHDLDAGTARSARPSRQRFHGLGLADGGALSVRDANNLSFAVLTHGSNRP